MARRTAAAKTRQRLRAPASVTLREASEKFLEGIRSGAIANRSGETYKPSAVRSYEQALRTTYCPTWADGASATLPPPTCKHSSSASAARG